MRPIDSVSRRIVGGMLIVFVSVNFFYLPWIDDDVSAVELSRKFKCNVGLVIGAGLTMNGLNRLRFPKQGDEPGSPDASEKTR